MKHSNSESTHSTTTPGADSFRGRPTVTRYIVLGGLCAAASISYLARNCIGVAEQAVRNEFGLTLDQMSWIMSGFFITYAAFQIPCGWLADAWGSRRALPLYAAVWSVATVATGLAGGFWILFLTRLLAGIGQAGIFPGSVNTISRWIPISRRALACGALASFMSVGGAVAVALTGLLLDGGNWFGLQVPSLSWRWVFALFALPGFVWTMWFYYWFRDDPRQHGSVNPAELELIQVPGDTAAPSKQPGPIARPIPWTSILTHRDMWWICGQQFFRAAGYIFYATWFPTYLQKTRGVSTAQSGLLTSLPLLAVVVGALLGGLLVDWVFNRTKSVRLSRQVIGIVAMLACAGFIFAAYFVQETMAAVSLITAGSFCAALAGPCGYSITIDKGGDHVAIVFSTMNMMGNIGAAICPVVVARLVTLTGSWDLVLFLFAGIYVAAAICWGALDPTGTILPCEGAVVDGGDR